MKRRFGSVALVSLETKFLFILDSLFEDHLLLQQLLDFLLALGFDLLGDVFTLLVELFVGHVEDGGDVSVVELLFEVVLSDVFFVLLEAQELVQIELLVRLFLLRELLDRLLVVVDVVSVFVVRELVVESVLVPLLQLMLQRFPLGGRLVPEIKLAVLAQLGLVFVVAEKSFLELFPFGVRHRFALFGDRSSCVLFHLPHPGLVPFGVVDQALLQLFWELVDVVQPVVVNLLFETLHVALLHRLHEVLFGLGE